MDQVSARKAPRDGPRARRKRMRMRMRMRDQARSQQPVQSTEPDRYQTPEWLDRSFVLPLTQPEANHVPSQSVGRHDDDPNPLAEPRVTPHAEAEALAAPTPDRATPTFVRPPSEVIDFARIIRRSDLCRTVTRVHWAATGLACAALIAYLLIGSSVVLALVVVCAAIAVAAFVVRVRLTRAPVPRLQR